MISLSDLPPPSEALVFYIEMREEDLHFFESAVRGLYGIVNPRRDMKLHNGVIYYKNYVSADLRQEFEALLSSMRSYIFIGDYVVEEPLPR
ncbi:MAG: hypothetical protein NZ610_06845 [Candidatus Bipolaricaulota bacterium]|nr:hypothetical protein [Candidatus Bipolaricaulota bacterium]MCS7275096.1 hypothetical protein [Candidatus Bipolaricaulota bacterium]MDW8110424.1 hypothetical protein [Candidatus Bipolaricaulota bacterium]MDW8329724.1 hypothetical protein [Candidatus Bipolaricaulota bacterium]